ncbi:MAG: hypothetical protein U0169_22650 [Polyangiaceae bacterium]
MTVATRTVSSLGVPVRHASGVFTKTEPGTLRSPTAEGTVEAGPRTARSYPPPAPYTHAIAMLLEEPENDDEPPTLRFDRTAVLADDACPETSRSPGSEGPPSMPSIISMRSVVREPHRVSQR